VRERKRERERERERENIECSRKNDLLHTKILHKNISRFFNRSPEGKKRVGLYIKKSERRPANYNNDSYSLILQK
jgi:hypothetical protein